MGMADSLGASVREALLAIATTGECKAAGEAWILFGEVTACSGSPHFYAAE